MERQTIEAVKEHIVSQQKRMELFQEESNVIMQLMGNEIERMSQTVAICGRQYRKCVEHFTRLQQSMKYLQEQDARFLQSMTASRKRPMPVDPALERPAKQARFSIEHDRVLDLNKLLLDTTSIRETVAEAAARDAAAREAIAREAAMTETAVREAAAREAAALEVARDAAMRQAAAREAAARDAATEAARRDLPRHFPAPTSNSADHSAAVDAAFQEIIRMRMTERDAANARTPATEAATIEPRVIPAPPRPRGRPPSRPPKTAAKGRVGRPPVRPSGFPAAQLAPRRSAEPHPQGAKSPQPTESPRLGSKLMQLLEAAKSQARGLPASPSASSSSFSEPATPTHGLRPRPKRKAPKAPQRVNPPRQQSSRQQQQDSTGSPLLISDSSDDESRTVLFPTPRAPAKNRSKPLSKKSGIPSKAQLTFNSRSSSEDDEPSPVQEPVVTFDTIGQSINAPMFGGEPSESVMDSSAAPASEGSAYSVRDARPSEASAFVLLDAASEGSDFSVLDAFVSSTLHEEREEGDANDERAETINRRRSDDSMFIDLDDFEEEDYEYSDRPRNVKGESGRGSSNAPSVDQNSSSGVGPFGASVASDNHRDSQDMGGSGAGGTGASGTVEMSAADPEEDGTYTPRSRLWATMTSDIAITRDRWLSDEVKLPFHEGASVLVLDEVL